MLKPKVETKVSVLYFRNGLTILKRLKMVPSGALPMEYVTTYIPVKRPATSCGSAFLSKRTDKNKKSISCQSIRKDSRIREIGYEGNFEVLFQGNNSFLIYKSVEHITSGWEIGIFLPLPTSLRWCVPRTYHLNPDHPWFSSQEIFLLDKNGRYMAKDTASRMERMEKQSKLLHWNVLWTR